MVCNVQLRVKNMKVDTKRQKLIRQSIHILRIMQQATSKIIPTLTVHSTIFLNDVSFTPCRLGLPSRDYTPAAHAQPCYLQYNHSLIIKLMQKQTTPSSIQVFVRVRPSVSHENHSEEVVQVLSDERTVRVTHDDYNHMQIKFDHAFNQFSSQDDIYKHFQPHIPKVMNGYNVTLFAYGQTGSGKTYTMFGDLSKQQSSIQTTNIDINHSQGGVIPRAIEQIFKKVKQLKKTSIFCSFLQIYNQKIYDLLQDTEKPKPLSIHESKVQGIFVQGLTEFGVNNSADCLELMHKGIKNRIIRQTSMNAKSSRSHSIFQLLFQMQETNGMFLKGRLNLCDLAGSEKINKKEAMGDAQLKELKNINLSLTTLGKVIYALSSGDKKVSGAFRESKLTRLLQQSLTGNTYTFVMANLSPSLKNLQQTMNTLKFVERANHITLKVKPTEIAKNNPDEVIKLEKEVHYLRELLNMKKQGINPQEMSQHLKQLMKQNSDLKNKLIPDDYLENLMKENRQMKKEIHNLQVKLEQTQGTESSLDTEYAKFRKKEKQLQREKLDFYAPSSLAPSSRGSRNSSSNSHAQERMSGSLVNAGNSIVFNKMTIEDPPNRNQEKRNLAKRLQDFEDKKQHEQIKLMQDYQKYEKKVKGRYSPPKMNSPKGKLSGKREESYALRNRKKVDYHDKIKQLEARLFGK